jgi:uncharacterized protein
MTSSGMGRGTLRAMSAPELALLVTGIFAIAVLYSSVGHAGGSGYIAWLALLGFAPSEIRPVALGLNILAASVATVQFARAGLFSFRRFWPFALLAIPAALVGGALELPTRVFQVILGLVLVYSAVRFFVRKADSTAPPREAPLPAALGTGAGIGFLSGLTGTGGGIFLSPLVIFLGWMDARTASGLAAPFILVNSISGLAGYYWSSNPHLPAFFPLLAAGAVGGAALGSRLGSRRLAIPAIQKALAAVLLLAAAKLLLT